MLSKDGNPRLSAGEYLAKLQEVRETTVRVNGQVRKVKRNGLGWLLPDQGVRVGQRMEKVVEEIPVQLPPNQAVLVGLGALALVQSVRAETGLSTGVIVEEAKNIPLGATRIFADQFPGAATLVFDSGWVKEPPEREFIPLTDKQADVLVDEFVAKWEKGVPIGENETIRNRMIKDLKRKAGKLQQQRFEETVIAIQSSGVDGAGDKFNPDEGDLEYVKLHFYPEEKALLKQALLQSK